MDRVIVEQKPSSPATAVGRFRRSMQSADGKNYLTDVADTEQFLRLVQSIPSPASPHDKPAIGSQHKQVA